jgi:hypothetical protein
MKGLRFLDRFECGKFVVRFENRPVKASDSRLLGGVVDIHCGVRRGGSRGTGASHLPEVEIPRSILQLPQMNFSRGEFR